MWKPIALSTLIGLGISSQAMAHDSFHVDTSDCNVSTDYAIEVGPDFFTVDGENGKLMTFQLPSQLSVDGEPLPLNSEQEQLLQEYRQQLHIAGRDTLVLTLEAIDIAMDGLSIAINALAGPDHPDILELQQLSADLIQRTEDRLNREGEIYQLGGEEIGDYIEKTISEEFEPRIERLAMESAGTIAWHALKAAFTGGQSIEEQATEEAERLIEQRAENIEQSAYRLCTQLKTIDRLETDLHQLVPELSHYDIVKTNLVIAD
ncbi:hypothetical protein BTJ40_20590 [Microbulbifer sp. A4B17]|uniref:DUF2884 family protein n=1 Tax=Microbulbifer sp. A4B17 TaxID=359370 RepID=UPI000D52B8A8|nr:DUF2884 family protein [Microbulbifer sp. A4B17]AWF83024.1 hypothetical protein BTJ40_20590 [Microbulbifer sp. A4B17]